MRLVTICVLNISINMMCVCITRLKTDRERERERERSYQAVPVNDKQVVSSSTSPGVASKHDCSLHVHGDHDEAGASGGDVSVAGRSCPLPCRKKILGKEKKVK